MAVANLAIHMSTRAGLRATCSSRAWDILIPCPIELNSGCYEGVGKGSVVKRNRFAPSKYFKVVFCAAMESAGSRPREQPIRERFDDFS